MVFALVHFAAGFVCVLLVLSLVPVTRYRLTGAYLGGVWALGPDVHHLLDDPLSARVFALHNSPVADVFFLHRTLDGARFEAANVELTFLATAALGLSFVCFDWRFGRPVAGRRASTTEATDRRPSG